MPRSVLTRFRLCFPAMSADRTRQPADYFRLFRSEPRREGRNSLTGGAVKFITFFDDR